MSVTTMTLLAACFLPLFPLSVAFNALFRYLRHPVLRTVLLLTVSVAVWR